MTDYLINTPEMNRIFELLNGILKIRITFFDLQFHEINTLNIQPSSAFCRVMRRDRDFDSLCNECDRKHLEICKRKHDVHVYHCHAGLLEGIVPLYRQEGTYLGAIFFGQVIDEASPPDGKFIARMKDMQISTKENMLKIGALLKYLGEYICRNELIKKCSRPWTDLFAEYVEANLDKPITLSSAARAVNRPVSFLAHNISAEFGISLKGYVRQKRMIRAAKLLAGGKLVRECAWLLGYKDEFYFSRDFKKHFGCAPKYMKHSLQKPDER